MADRIDALGSDSSRFAVLGGRALASEHDDELDECADHARAELRAPFGLVSLLLTETQFFRASRGLPEEITAAGGARRDTSFCQFVVRDGALFEVTDAQTDPRVPKEQVKNFGIRSYLGAPVTANSVVVGSLCVLDTVARSFTLEEKQYLEALAKRASTRLEALTRERSAENEPLIKAGAVPAFVELREMLMPLRLGVEDADTAIAKLGREIKTSLPRATEFAALADLGADASFAARRIRALTSALERVTTASLMCAPLRELAATGIELSRSASKLVGGVIADPVESSSLVLCTLPVGASLISTSVVALAELSANLDPPSRLELSIKTEDDDIVLSLAAGGPTALDPLDLANAVRVGHSLLPANAFVSIDASARGFDLRFPGANHNDTAH